MDAPERGCGGMTGQRHGAGRMRKDRLDGTGWAVLVAVGVLLAVNQTMMKEVSQGIQPVFAAGLRSLMAVPVVWGWLMFRGLTGRVRLADLGPGLLIGVVFAIEFLGLFLAIDLTAVGRASVLFYSMPLWMAVLAHFTLEGERLTPVRSAGLGLAFAGTAWAIWRETRPGCPTSGAILRRWWAPGAGWARPGLRA